MENGQYNKDWAKIHNMPEEAAQAAVDVNAKKMISVHNSKFALARHQWTEPMERILATSQGKPYEFMTPMISDKISLDDGTASTAISFPIWWR